MARDRNFQRKQKDARMPTRDSHGEDRMAARQGEPDYDLRRARDAPSSGTSRNRRQAAPVQTETYGSDIFAGCENSDTAAQDSPSTVLIMLLCFSATWLRDIKFWSKLSNLIVIMELIIIKLFCKKTDWR